MNSNHNYSDILRLRSHEFYSNVRNRRDVTTASPQTTTNPPTTVPTTAQTTTAHNWLQMSRDFQPILRSNSSLSLDQKRGNNQNNNFLNSTSIDFKDFQELRECRSDRTTTSTTTKSVSSVKSSSSKTVMAKKSRTIGSIQSLSISNENLSKIHSKSGQKSKTKSLFFKTKNNETSSESSKVDLLTEETERRRRLRQLFIHYDIQSALSLDELFIEDQTKTSSSTPTTPTTPDVKTSPLKSEDETENEFNSNSLLGFSPNFRNEIGKELVYCLQLTRDNSDNNQMTSNNDNRRQQRTTRCPTHSPSLARQLSCLSSFDMSSDPSQSSLLSPTVCPFSKEFDENCLESDFGFNYYRKYFYGFSHQNWFQVLDNKTAIALSLRKDSKDLKKLRIILRTNHSLKSLKGFLNLNQLSSEVFSLRSIFQMLLPPKTPIEGFRLGFDSKSDELLLKLDELLENHSFKIGILYSRDSQSTEEEFYNNREILDKDFDEFLSLIGTRVRLKGYKGFRGGLDVTTDTTGLYAFATHFEGNEIIYHVMHELPFSNNNRQQLLRKRHIGNDIVTIVFQSKRFRGKPFQANQIRSHFQHVFLIVRPHHNGYRIAIARHKDVPPFGPPLKSFYRKEELRDFLLAKVVNAENACHKCAKFKQMALRTRFEYLNDLFKNYSTQTTLASYLSSNHGMNSPLFGTSSSSSSTQQLIQFSQNFNKYFSQIFPKKSSKKTSNSDSINDLSKNSENETKSIFLENELFFGAKLYESIEELTTTDDTLTTLSLHQKSREEARSRLLCHSFQENRDLNSVKIVLNQNFLIVLNENKKKFVLNLKQILGFLLQNSSEVQKKNASELDINLKIYLHQGELLLLKELIRLPVPVLDSESIDAIIEKNSILFELKSDLMTKIRDFPSSLSSSASLPLNDSSLRCRQMKCVLLRRNLRTNDNSFGFHIQTKKVNSSENSCVFVTEVNEHALRVNGLKAGQRLLELCSIPTISLNYEQILDFLKTSQTVSVSLVQPLSDGSPPVNGCFARICGQNNDKSPENSSKSSENLRQNVVNNNNSNNNDYENIQSVVQTTTTRHQTTASPQHPVYQSTTPTITQKTTAAVVTTTSPQHNTQQQYGSPVAHNSRHQQTTTTTGASPQHMTSHNQRPLQLKPNLHFNANQNHSSQSSTTSSSLQEDLIKLLTLNDTEIEDTNDRIAVESSNPTDSHSSSRYSTATSTPYSSLERRSDRQTTSGRHATDDCVVTVAKPAFVVNSVNEFGFGRQLRDDALNSNVVPTDLLSLNDDDDEDDPELEWPSLPVLNEEHDTQLKEQVKELSKEKLRLNETIRQLKEENQRLHFESQTASQQLRKFTEWFFSSNQNQNN